MPGFESTMASNAPPLQQQSHRIRRRPVSFGNPALGTYEGNVYTLESPVSPSTKPQQEEYTADVAGPPPPPPSPFVFPLPVVEQAMSVQRMVAMVDVPPEQVPDGIFNLIRVHQCWIKHLRILIAGPMDEGHDSKDDADNNENNKSNLAQSSRDTACIPVTIQDSLTLQQVTQERRYLILMEIESDEAAEELVQDLHGQPYTSLDETCCCSMYHVVALQGHDNLQFAIGPSISSESSQNRNQQDTSKPSLTSKQQSSVNAASNREASNCAVCLERLQNPGESSSEQSCIFTTVCNHSFHMDCLLKWQDASCPVCRHDHSGLNETLSQCHICGTTENNYVCLICGVVSCGRPSAAATSPWVGGATAITTTTATTQHASSSFLNDDECSGSLNRGTLGGRQTPANISALSHARQHYDETLHAYALDTETQHVWDFAGQGYVHRLLQNKDDGKLVEVSDPSALSEERTQNPGLSETQEEQAVHQKLEGMASSYYTLLKSQLEQQRIYYEGRLDEIRLDNRPQRAADHISALKQERHQLSQRLVILQSRRNKTKEDATFLNNMVDSLEKNKEALREEVAAVQKSRQATRVMFENCLPPLQEKVTRLMLQLEAEFSAATTPIVEDIGNETANDKKQPASRRSKK